MRLWQLKRAIFAASCCLMFAAHPTAGEFGERSVVAARLLYASFHDRQAHEQAKALYVHENLQPIIMEVERTLLGPAIPARVIVFVRPERSDRFSVEWLGSYGILSPSEWQAGQNFLLILTTRGEYNEVCQLFAPKADDMNLFDPGLNDYRGLPGFCASLGDIYRVDQPK